MPGNVFSNTPEINVLEWDIEPQNGNKSEIYVEFKLGQVLDKGVRVTR